MNARVVYIQDVTPPESLSSTAPEGPVGAHSRARFGAVLAFPADVMPKSSDGCTMPCHARPMFHPPEDIEALLRLLSVGEAHSHWNTVLCNCSSSTRYSVAFRPWSVCSWIVPLCAETDH